MIRDILHFEIGNLELFIAQFAVAGVDDVIPPSGINNALW